MYINRCYFSYFLLPCFSSWKCVFFPCKQSPMEKFSVGARASAAAFNRQQSKQPTHEQAKELHKTEIANKNIFFAFQKQRKKKQILFHHKSRSHFSPAVFCTSQNSKHFFRNFFYLFYVININMKHIFVGGVASLKSTIRWKNIYIFCFLLWKYQKKIVVAYCALVRLITHSIIG